MGLEEVWINFGVGKHVRVIAAHNIASSLGVDKSRALPFFHALTGCDTTSCFSHRGKKSAWETWNVYPEVTNAFLDLCELQEGDITKETIKILERFVVILYDRTSEQEDLNSCRKQLFSKRSCTLELLPPTSDAFMLHVKRAVYQGVFIWGQCLAKNLTSTILVYGAGKRLTTNFILFG